MTRVDLGPDWMGELRKNHTSGSLEDFLLLLGVVYFCAGTKCTFGK